jgi:hypothetical protein
MKKTYYLYLFIILSIFFNTSLIFSQNNTTSYSISLNGAAATKNTLPFWLKANTFGTVPNRDFASVNPSFFGNFTAKNNAFNFEYKASFTGFLTPSKKTIVNELYGTLLFKKWNITLGNKNDAIQWEGLSSSNGNIIKSTNTRALPGINIETNGYINLPFAKNWLSAKFNYAEYLLNDNRYVNHAHLHHKSLYFKSKLNSKLSVITGLDHYVQWGGTSVELGKMPNSFKDYLRIITGSSGGASSLAGEQINALGNTVGAYLLQFNYKGIKTNWSFYYSHPFEDRSGREMQNWPDGIYGLFINFKKSTPFIKNILLEFTNTKNMSGSNPPDDANGGRGLDNYFNNSIYQSGWTYFGNVMGSPYFVTKPIENGITKGVNLDFSRFNNYHFAFGGTLLNNLTYKTHLSYTNYFGWFSNPVRNKVFSGSLQFYFQSPKLPFEIQLTTAADFGNTLPNTVGGFVAIVKKGNF